MEIKGLPEKIEAACVVKAFETMGIDTRNVRSAHVYAEAVEVEIYSERDNGQRYFVDDGVTVACNKVFIPVVGSKDL